MSLVLLYNSPPVANKTTDPFTRTSTTTLGSTPEGYVWTSNSGTWGTNGSQAYCVNEADGSTATLSTGLENNDVSAVIPVIAANSFWSIIASYVDDNNMTWLYHDSSNGNVTLTRKVAGTQTFGPTYSIGVVAGDTLRVRRVDQTRYEVYRNGTLVGTTDDTWNQFPGITKVGMRYGGIGAQRWDDFSANTAAPPVQKTGSDTVTPSATETTAFTIGRTAQDTVLAAVVDASSPIVISGLVIKSASDTDSPAIVDTTAVAVLPPGADAINPVIVETASIAISGTVTKSASDDENPSIVDASSISVSSFLSASDTLTPSIFEGKGAYPGEAYPGEVDVGMIVVVSGTMSVTASDVLTPKTVEPAGATVGQVYAGQFYVGASGSDLVKNSGGPEAKAASDTLAPAITETATLNVSASASDTLAPAITETAGFGTVAVSASDIDSPIVVDTIAILNSSGLAQDTLTPTLVDASAIAISGLVIKTAADTLTPAIIDTVSTRQAGITVSDTLTPIVLETTAFGTVAVSAVDTDSPVIVDTSATATSGLAQDTLIPAVVETALVEVSGSITRSGADTFVPVVVDVATAPEVTILVLAVSDTLAPAVVDTRVSTNITTQASDTASPAIVDVAATYATGLSQDILSPSIVDTATIEVSGAVSKTSSDALTPVIIDQGASPGVTLTQKSALDTIAPVLVETTVTASYLNASDALVSSINDTAVLNSAGLAQDTLALSFVETAAIVISGTVTKEASENLAPVTIDTVSTRQAGITASDTIGPILVENVRASGNSYDSFADNFDRVNSNTLGQNWVEYANGFNGFSVTSNAAVPDSEFNASAFSVPITNTDQFAQVTVSTLPPASTFLGLNLRAPDAIGETAALTGSYWTLAFYGATGLDTVAWRYKPAGVTAHTTLGTQVTLGVALAAGTVIRGEVFTESNGDITLVGYVNGAEVIRRVDVAGASIAIAGQRRTGIYHDGPSGATQFATFDNFSAGAASVLKTASDTVTPAIVDQGISPGVTLTQKTASDTITPVLVDTSVGVVQNTPFITLAASDTLTSTVTDTSAAQAYGLAADLLVPAIVETSAIATSGTVTKAASETVTPAIVDTVAVTMVKAGTDTLAPSISDTSSVVATGIFTVVATDTLLSAITETSIVARSLSRTDTIAPVITETAVIFIARTATETIVPLVTDEGVLSTSTVVVNIQKTAADIVKATLAETASHRLPVPATVKIWNGTSFVAGQLKVWNGTNWHIPVIKVWNGNAWI